MPDWYSVAPECIKTGDLGAGFENLAPPFADCTGFFTFGGGTIWAGAPGEPFPQGDQVGDVVSSASTALYVLTAVGFAVSMLAFVAWVWFENRKLTAQAAKLREAKTPEVGGGVAPPGAGSD